ncbi:MAG: hypothetical protein Q4C98_03695 [Capnocytophaga sp.]|nr:hypothetical protein [Capnocytophaga sp.]
MRYTKLDCEHELDDEPIVYISAFDEFGDEQYRVEIFRCGKRLYADRSNAPEDDIWLDNLTLAEVLALTDPEDEFFSVEIDKETFEQYWNVPENEKFKGN